MPRCGWLLLGWVSLLPLAAEDAPVLPELPEGPPPDIITPVPLPEGFGGAAVAKPEMPKSLRILYNGGGTVSKSGGILLEGPVKITGDNGMEVFSDRAELLPKDESVVLEGNVSAYQGNILQRGDRAVYYYNRKYLDSSHLAMAVDSVIMEAGKFTAEKRANGKQVLVGENSGITLHDDEDPNFWVRADKTTVYPGDRVTFRNLKLYAGDVPVFWLPYLAQPLDSELGYHFIPGARSGWGAYLLNSYGIMLGGEVDPVTGDRDDAWLLSKWRFDLRSQRGVGVGVDLIDTRTGNRENLSGLTLYYIHDLDPSDNPTGLVRERVQPDRYGAELRQRFPLDIKDSAAWYLDANFGRYSDEYYLQDFRPDFFRSNPWPDNTAGIYRRDGDSLLSLYTRFQTNGYQRMATRLPEISFDQSRRPVPNTPLLHEGVTSLGKLSLEMDDYTRDRVIDPLLAMSPGNPRALALIDELQSPQRQMAARLMSLPAGSPEAADLRDRMLSSGFWRFHTFHEWSLPLAVTDWLHVTPRVGGGYTGYFGVDGPASSESRLLAHAGAEASVKFSRDFGPIRNHDWGLDGLRHVVEPYADWSFVSTDDLPQYYPVVDRATFTTRPQTLDPTRFTAIDDLRSWNILRMGVRNHLLTRRDGGAHPWLFMDTSMDALFKDPDAEFADFEDRNFSNLRNDLRFTPLPWLGLGVDTQFPLIDGGSKFNEIGTYVRFEPFRDADVLISYRRLSNHPLLNDSNRLDLRGFLRLNEHWGLGAQQVWELDDGTLELQQYTVHRDLGNWIVAMGVSSRDNRVHHEYGLVFSLTLKDLPALSLPFRIDAP